MSDTTFIVRRDGLRLLRTALGATAALFALSGSALAHVVVRDATTGDMRPATSQEFAALKAQEAAQKALAAQQKAAAPVLKKSLSATAAAAPPVNLPGNTVQGTLDEESVMYSVMTRDTDGKLVLQCVRGKSAVDAAVNQNAPVSTHTEEHQHDAQ